MLICTQGGVTAYAILGSRGGSGTNHVGLRGGNPRRGLSGASWSDMLKKLQDFRWPMILDLASASSTTTGSASGK